MVRLADGMIANGVGTAVNSTGDIIDLGVTSAAIAAGTATNAAFSAFGDALGGLLGATIAVGASSGGGSSGGGGSSSYDDTLLKNKI